MAGAEHMDASIRTDALQRCASEFERFALATEAGGFKGLPLVSRHLQANLLALAEQAQLVTPPVAQRLEGCLRSVQAYLSAPSVPATVDRLVSSVADPAWMVRFDAGGSEALRADLAGIVTLDIGDAGSERASVATLEDVSLEVPGDVNPELLDALLQEMPGHTEALSAAVQRMAAGGSLEDVNIAQRLAHTLKGAGNTVGVRGIATLTHHLEDVLLALARARTLPTRPLAASLMLAADCLEGMSEALLGEGTPPGDMREVLQDVLDWANRIDRDGIAESRRGAGASRTGGSAARRPRGHTDPRRSRAAISWRRRWSGQASRRRRAHAGRDDSSAGGAGGRAAAPGG